MPLLLGKFRLDKPYYGLLGLIITALFLTFDRSIVINTASFFRGPGNDGMHIVYRSVKYFS
jgi:hypothetical protein